ncbi:ABC transporter ATP-binding protein [Thermoflavimicrobium daqui]|jgi:ABC-2 type transport system ATP-binding protein|uniref:ABC transporter ATP-binding protein n=1 Tax=Thermoflavimicrobium daqui TaxID=2137476 RepID=A0A364K1H9_9BACL|nr:ABC transporter ATP-binding protein [Thermoflavimicrobium daqui]RAL21882.1 ABC transporter ATP-binding protein [Thermoflavimicrobium daqui]
MIQIENLCKTYQQVPAVNNLNLQIEPGSVFGFIGPNGSGKTTTMQILATLLKPSSGKAWVGGYDVQTEAEEVRRMIGYMPDFFGVYDYLTVMEYMEFYGACYQIEPSQSRKVAKELLELVKLSEKQNHYVDELSRGMQQRLGLARCLIHDPKVLILDEPASGLDPRARIEFREILKKLQQMGKTIMISSHILPELADLCDTIGVIEAGKLVTSGAVSDMLVPKNQARTLEVHVLEEVKEAEELLQQSEYVQSIRVEKNCLYVKFTGDSTKQVQLVQQLAKANVPVLQIFESKLNIEDVFMKVTDKEGNS